MPFCLSTRGSIRSGKDVLKAVARAARGVWIGRPFLYGLGAGGKAGVTRGLEILRNELDITMALCGRRELRSVRRALLDVDADSPAWLREARVAAPVAVAEPAFA